MNLQQLYYFRKLAEVQHYTKAAKALYITQPSLSDSIASLEHELSVSLFQKKGRGVQLTKYGQEFYEYVNQALGILEHGIAIMKEKSDLVTGTIDVGCIPTYWGIFFRMRWICTTKSIRRSALIFFMKSPFRWQRESPPVTMISASVPW